MYVGLSLTQ